MSSADRLTAPSVPETLHWRALQAARKLLEAQGSEGLHLRTIAAKIGCGTASLYYHFKDKDALLGGLALQGFRELSASMAEVLARKEFVRDIDSVSAGYLNFMGQNLQLYALMYSQHLLASNEAVREAEQQIVHRFQNALNGDERVPSNKVEEAALAYSALGRGIASLVLSQGRIDPKARIVLGQKIVDGVAVLLSTEFLQASAAGRR